MRGILNYIVKFIDGSVGFYLFAVAMFVTAICVPTLMYYVAIFIICLILTALLTGAYKLMCMAIDI